METIKQIQKIQEIEQIEKLQQQQRRVQKLWEEERQVRREREELVQLLEQGQIIPMQQLEKEIFVNQELIQTPFGLEKEILRQQVPYQLEKELLKEQFLNKTTPFGLEKEILKKEYIQPTPFGLEKEVLKKEYIQTPYQLEKELIQTPFLNGKTMPFGWTNTVMTTMPRHQLVKKQWEEKIQTQTPFELVEEKKKTVVIPTTTVTGVTGITGITTPVVLGNGRHYCVEQEQILLEEIELEQEERRVRRQLRREHERKQLIKELVRKYHLGQIVNKEELVEQLRYLEKEMTKKWEIEEEECMLLEQQLRRHYYNKVHAGRFFPVVPVVNNLPYIVKREFEQEKELEKREQLKQLIREEKQQIRRELYNMQQREFFEQQGRRFHHEEEKLRRQVEQQICQQRQFF